MLLASGRLDEQLFGPGIDPYRRAIDADKRLFAGPLDGNGRRSLYIKMTLMEPPRLLRSSTSRSRQDHGRPARRHQRPRSGLALLNDPFVVGQAEFWGRRLASDGAASVDERIGRMFAAALGRPPEPEERDRFRAGRSICRIAAGGRS